MWYLDWYSFVFLPLVELKYFGSFFPFQIQTILSPLSYFCPFLEANWPLYGGLFSDSVFCFIPVPHFHYCSIVLVTMGDSLWFWNRYYKWHLAYPCNAKCRSRLGLHSSENQTSKKAPELKTEASGTWGLGSRQWCGWGWCWSYFELVTLWHFPLFYFQMCNSNFHFLKTKKGRKQVKQELILALGSLVWLLIMRSSPSVKTHWSSILVCALSHTCVCAWTEPFMKHCR